jgi:hypothetical protein
MLILTSVFLFIESYSQDIADFGNLRIGESDFIFDNNEDYSDSLITAFPINEDDYKWISDSNSEANWISFKNELLKLCKQKELCSESLEMSLNTINGINTDVALLPIAAYLAHIKNSPVQVWVISCKWGNKHDMMHIKDGGHIWTEYNHVRQWAIETDKFTKIAYWTCE